MEAIFHHFLPQLPPGYPDKLPLQTLLTHQQERHILLVHIGGFGRLSVTLGGPPEVPNLKTLLLQRSNASQN